MRYTTCCQIAPSHRFLIDKSINSAVISAPTQAHFEVSSLTVMTERTTASALHALDIPTVKPGAELNEKYGPLTSPVKSIGSDVDIVAEKGYHSERSSQLGSVADDDVVLVNGEPVITTGRDVSRFLVDVRDDGDPALTFRSLFLGTVFAGLGASLVQVCLQLPHDLIIALTELQIYLFKPVQMSVSTVFLLLLIYSVGVVWAAVIPRASSVEGTRWSGLAPFLHFINPGPFGLKEVRALVPSMAYWTE